MADPASLAQSISEAFSRAISETVNAALAQVRMQPEIQQWRIWSGGSIMQFLFTQQFGSSHCDRNNYSKAEVNFKKRNCCMKKIKIAWRVK